MKTVASLLFASLIGPSSALACSCAYAPVNDMIANHDYAFAGEIVSQGPNTRKMQSGTIKGAYLLKTDRVLRGNVDPYVPFNDFGFTKVDGDSIMTTSTSCDLKLQPGQHYLFFVDGPPPYKAMMCSSIYLGDEDSAAQTKLDALLAEKAE